METELPRYQKPNPYNYTEVQLSKRKRDIKAMIADYPTVNGMWCEWLYDVIENMPPEEVENIINNKLWEGNSKFAKALGGTSNAVEVLNKDGTPFIYEEKKIIE